MISRTNEEILAKLKQLWPSLDRARGKSPFEIERENKHIDLRISNMYERPGLSFALIMELAKFFDTKNVETESEFNYGGCESCDYGSEYGFVLRVRDGDRAY